MYPEYKAIDMITKYNFESFVLAFFLIIFWASSSSAQLSKKAVKLIGRNPILFIDSVQSDIHSFTLLNPFDISNISILKPKKAKRIIRSTNPDADGVVYVTTVKAAKLSYWNYLCTKSNEYKQLINSPRADTIVQYVLNGQPLSNQAAPGKLFLLTNKNFKSLKVSAKEKSSSDALTLKRFVVTISAKH